METNRHTLLITEIIKFISIIISCTFLQYNGYITAAAGEGHLSSWIHIPRAGSKESQAHEGAQIPDLGNNAFSLNNFPVLPSII